MQEKKNYAFLLYALEVPRKNDTLLAMAHLMSRICFLNLLPDRKEYGVPREMPDSRSEQEKYKEILKHSVSNTRKFSKTNGGHIKMTQEPA
jgi:hypothetical protein